MGAVILTDEIGLYVGTAEYRPYSSLCRCSGIIGTGTEINYHVKIGDDWVHGCSRYQTIHIDDDGVRADLQRFRNQCMKVRR